MNAVFLAASITCLVVSLAIVCGIYAVLAVQLVRVRRRKGTS